MSKEGERLKKRMKAVLARREKVEKKIPKDVQTYVKTLIREFDLGLALSFSVNSEEYNKVIKEVYH